MSAAELLRDAKPSTTRVCKSVIIKGAMRWAKAPGQVRLIAQQLYPDGSWRNVPIVEVTAQEIAEAFTSNDTVSFHPPSPKATVVAPAPPLRLDRASPSAPSRTSMASTLSKTSWPISSAAGLTRSIATASTTWWSRWTPAC